MRHCKVPSHTEGPRSTLAHYPNQVGKQEKSKLARPNNRCEDNIKIELKQNLRLWTRLNWLRTGYKILPL
jgi:hypothetical protein